MKYMLLIYEKPQDFADRSDPAKSAAYWAGWSNYGRMLTEAGVMIDGAGLQPPETATTVTLRGGERQIQDGPYADTKEQIGGFYVIDVPDLDTALELTASCPAAASGAVEVRPYPPARA